MASRLTLCLALGLAGAERETFADAPRSDESR